MNTAPMKTEGVDISPEAVEWRAEQFAAGSETARMLRALRTALTASESRFSSAAETLVDIAAMGKKAGSESAKHRLTELGIDWATAELKCDYGSMT